jgi:hypothetical protein
MSTSSAQDSVFSREKPLPVAPGLPRPPRPNSIKPLPQKPLPDPPARPRKEKLTSTILIVFGLLIWFLAIVTLLPIILEREAMPGLNKFLRQIAGTVLQSLGGGQRMAEL